MKIRHDHYHHFDDDILGRMERLLAKELRRIMATLDELVAAAEAEDTKIDSLIALTATLKAKVDAIVSGALSEQQQEALDRAFAAVSDNPDRIQAAIDANTPSEATAEVTTETEV